MTLERVRASQLKAATTLEQSALKAEVAAATQALTSEVGQCRLTLGFRSLPHDGFQLLKPNYVSPLSDFAFSCNLRRYTEVDAKAARVAELERRLEEIGYDCAGGWGGWGECSVSCGGGMRTRQYAVTRLAERDGQPCPHPHQHVELNTCNRHPCPVMCHGGFSEWGECSAVCGRGRVARTYAVLAPAVGSGMPCPHAHNHTEEKFCERAKCLDDCPGQWGEWSKCDASCGAGKVGRCRLTLGFRS